jgi:molybdenum cofactor biosynthesis enzyme MoaA
MKIGEVDLFGKIFPAKFYLCNRNADKNDFIDIKKPRFNLFVNINNVCNAKCPFCNVHSNKYRGNVFNVEKFRKVLVEMWDKNLLGRIAISGGETFLDIALIDEILGCVHDVAYKDLPKITINTNGSKLAEIFKIKNLDKINELHISRHHYNDDINNSIFGIKTIGIDEIAEIKKNLPSGLIRFNCNLIKGFVDSQEEILKYLDTAVKLDLSMVGFVGLMKFNKFFKNKYINFKDLELNQNMTKIIGMYDYDICECEGYLYKQYDKEMEVYFRQVKNLNCKYCRQLVYTYDNKLKTSFEDDSIIF